ncbi:MAG TPA: hypothetical protein VFE47_18945 [Tepidisphaeraceae bacterium]|jgi:hypothetical protein|nr:hypothetical protein [Tepidisphaeraceae bacterium]
MKHRTSPPKLRRRIILPIFLALVGAFFLIGCIYLPIPEHKVGAEPDFRPMLGDENSARPIRNGAITRAQIMQRLGPPPFRSADGRAIGYTISTETGFAIWPTCFFAGPDQSGAYAVRLDFDEHGILKNWKLAHYQDRFGNFALSLANESEQALLHNAAAMAIEQLNGEGPKLVSGGILATKGP